MHLSSPELMDLSSPEHESGRTNGARGFCEWLLIILFVAGILLPLLRHGGWAIRFTHNPAVLAQSFSPAKLGPDFNREFDYRDTLIRWHDIAKLKALAVSPSSQAIVGKDGWLFFAGDQSMDSFRHTHPFTDAELDEWRRIFEWRQNWLAQRGIRYIFMVAPDKHSIYPEYMPDTLTQLRPDSRLDQLVAYLRRKSTFQILDLRPTLLKEKPNWLVYGKTDTHWNDAGAYFAYAAAVQHLQRWYPNLPAPSPGDYAWTKPIEPGGDIAMMLKLEDTIHDPDVQLEPRSARRVRVADGGMHLKPDPSNTRVLQFTSTSAAYRHIFVTECPEAPISGGIFLGDSFGERLGPFLSTEFGWMIQAWTQSFDARLIEHERPNVVIEELAERHLQDPPPQAYVW